MLISEIFPSQVINQASVSTLTRTFYARILANEELGPVIRRAVPEGYGAALFINAFWSSSAPPCFGVGKGYERRLPARLPEVWNLSTLNPVKAIGNCPVAVRGHKNIPHNYGVAILISTSHIAASI